ncbi:SH3 domain-containing protein [Leptolyngbya ohadii]|uniref:SH3 domain-containing protein n=1 Tax=Leptolyngbya ohadii TaxID=1962290 RepID=UPI000B59A49D|nr:SH3 domain-containing protein [Leptolyngbya ohadii]
MMKTPILFAATLLAIAPIAAVSPAFAQIEARQVLLAQAPQSGFINTNGVNIRSRPGRDGSVLYVADQGTQMRILGQYGSGSDSWIKVRAVSGSLPQTEGWVYRQYVTFGSTPAIDYYDQGYQAGASDAQAGRQYDPVAGSRNLPADASREYTRGYGAGYQASRPGGSNSLQQYYDRGYQDGVAAGRAGRTYDPVGGSRGLPAEASREYTRGYAAGYEAGRP